ncbi:MAG: outer membrane lipoprotein LolB [Pseudomonadota bacterium]
MRHSGKILSTRSAGLLLAGVLSLSVSGCATFVAPQKSGVLYSPLDAAADSARQYQENIDIGGRLSLRYEQDGLERVLDGKFTWNQSASLTRIALSTPFGQTLATIDLTPSMATLTQNGQAPRSARDVDALTASTLGWPLPISGLRDWLQGFALDQRGMRYVASADRNGDAAFVNTMDGWLIRYPTWEEGHPRRIDLQRLTSEAGQVNLRIVLDQWQERPVPNRKPG